MLSDTDEKITQLSITIAALAYARGACKLRQDEFNFTLSERRLACWIDTLKVYIVTHYIPHAAA